ncbi:MAG: ACT domain-containing protein, partial [Clostridia bacterium]
MLINQIAVFLENRKGRIDDLTKILAENKIDLVSMNIADTKEFGILRAITSDNKKAMECLKNAGFTVSSTDLVGIEVEDKPGGLAHVLTLLNEGGVSIEYLYSYAKKDKKAIILFKVTDIKKTLSIIEENHINSL